MSKVWLYLILTLQLIAAGWIDPSSVSGYALHSDFYYHFPKWRYAKVNVFYLTNSELAEVLGESEATVSTINGCHPLNSSDIYINIAFLLPRLPYSLDPNIHRVHGVITHEGVHVAQEYFNNADCIFLTRVTEIEWSKEVVPNWIRGLLQCGYFNSDHNTWEEYYRILWMEAMAWFLQTGGYHVRDGWPPDHTITQISELPSYMRSYVKSIKRMMRHD